MRIQPVTPDPFQISGNVSGASGAQASLILILFIFAMFLLASTTVKDPVLPVADWFAHFRAWGTENPVSDSTGVNPGVSITTPAEDDIYYNDEPVHITGHAIPDEDRKTTMVLYRVNEGEWARATVLGTSWSGTAEKYPQGNYFVEAVAYDDEGDSSAPADVNFTSLFRYVPDARYVSDDIPAEMTAGETYQCHITYENSGNLEWNSSAGYTLSPYSSHVFGSGSCAVSGPGVPPGGSISFDVLLTAPGTPGSYQVSYRMQGGGYGWFGDEARRQVNVLMPTYEASVVSVDLPAQMTSGERYMALIVMRNSGTATWYADGGRSVRLGTVGGNGGDAYRFAGVESLPMAGGTMVRPGGAYEFRFNIIAPAAGSYYPEFRMARQASIGFGEIAGKSIHIVPAATPTPAPTPVPTPVPTSSPYEAYNAYGKFRMIGKDGRQVTGYIFQWCYDGPFGRHNDRSCYLNEPWWPHPDWDIGGPNGHYTIYSDYYRGSGSFEMNYGGTRGPFTFYIK